MYVYIRSFFLRHRALLALTPLIWFILVRSESYTSICLGDCLFEVAMYTRR